MGIGNSFRVLRGGKKANQREWQGSILRLHLPQREKSTPFIGNAVAPHPDSQAWPGRHHWLLSFPHFVPQQISWTWLSNIPQLYLLLSLLAATTLVPAASVIRMCLHCPFLALPMLFPSYSLPSSGQSAPLEWQPHLPSPNFNTLVTPLRIKASPSPCSTRGHRNSLCLLFHPHWVPLCLCPHHRNLTGLPSASHLYQALPFAPAASFPSGMYS